MKLILKFIARKVSKFLRGFSKFKKLLNKKNLENSEQPFLIDDPELVFRGNPKYPEHDENGFRNRRIPQKVDVIAVGDSQVYGIMVSAKESWPYVLGKITKWNVYNASIGGWGVPQFDLVMNQQLYMGPKRIVVGVYTGQSIYKSFIFVRKSVTTYARSYWRPEYEFQELVDFNYHDVKNRIKKNLIHKNPEYKYPQVLAMCAKQGVEDCNFVELGNTNFYMEDTYRYLIQNIEHPAVKSAVEISKDALVRMAKQAREAEIEFSVVLIPTKEYLVYLRKDDCLIENLNTLIRLGENEQKLLEDLSNFCEARNINYYMLSNVLAEHLEDGIYWQGSDDGHPTALGCRYIASYLAEHIL